MRTRAWVVVLATVTMPHALAAQCPDGTPPPCSRARAPAPPDPHRIAILPFHVTTADTLLGEGLAELLATEFTGENGPRAVHMGSVLRAWRRAGGDLRTPLTQAAAVRLAREIDAGQYVEGSVVGLGGRLTVSASVQRLAGGRERNVGPFSGPADSLESLVGQMAAGLLAASGAEAQVDTRARLTAAPAAMRAYLAGLSAFRQFRPEEAGAAFDRALGIDSGFARAAFMRYTTSQWINTDADYLEPYARRAWQLRDRLSPQDRVLLVAFLGGHYPVPRTPAENLADRTRAAAQVPESPEAHYELGDYLYHSGTANNIPDHLERARVEFERSVGLDSQQTVIRHLIEIGLLLRDTALMRRAALAMDRVAPNALWDWAVALGLGDSTRAASLRPQVGWDGVAILGSSLDGGIPGEPLAERYAASMSSAPAEERDGLAYVQEFTQAVRGRSAEESPAPIPARAIVASALWADGDSARAAAAAGRLTADTTQWTAVAACVRAQWQLRTGSVPDYDAAWLHTHHQGLCVELLELALAARDRAPDLDRRLAAADSSLRLHIANLDGLGGYENLVLARLWESRGDLSRALSAVRLRTNGVCCQWSAATAAREEGRLAALAGDTAAAVRAYRRYLDLRSDARGALIPQRDSVEVELRKLERR